MIDYLDAHLRVRARALTLEVVAVTADIAATETGYERSAGSFLDDGFEVGHEVVGSGFVAGVNNSAKVITAVDDLTITTRGYSTKGDGDRVLGSTAGTSAEAEAEVTLSVGLPVSVEWENERLTPGVGIPWWREEWSPGPAQRIGPAGGPIESFVDYFLTLFIPEGVGPRAARSYASAILEHFPPGHPIVLTDSSVGCRVRGDVAPRAGQAVQSVDPQGFLELPITVPLLLRTASS